MSYVYSVTYRPAELKLSIDEFLQKINHKTIEKYFIGSETADDESDTINHYQCYVVSTQVCTNLRKRLKHSLEIENTCALKVETHNDPSYLLGYCQKEHRGFLTNIEEEELKKAEVYYNSKKEVIEGLNKAHVAGMTANDIYEQILEMHIKNKETQYRNSYFVEFYRKFRKQIKFNVLAKLNRNAMKYYIEMLIGESYEVEEPELV